MYIVKVVKHSGKRGVRGMNFLDQKYFRIVGTKCELEPIHTSQPLILDIKKPVEDTWSTSPVVSTREYKIDGVLNVEVETQNSIYTFEKV